MLSNLSAITLNTSFHVPEFTSPRFQCCNKQRLRSSPSSLNWRAFLNKANNILLEMERQKQVFILLLAKVTENDDETY